MGLFVPTWNPWTNVMTCFTREVACLSTKTLKDSCDKPKLTRKKSFILFTLLSSGVNLLKNKRPSLAQPCFYTCICLHRASSQHLVKVSDLKNYSSPAYHIQSTKCIWFGCTVACHYNLIGHWNVWSLRANGLIECKGFRHLAWIFWLQLK